MALRIMIQGTGSNVGKSVLVAGFCRLLAQDGYRVAPFKSQNMALNSFVTEDGAEMGRAQVFQAEAAGEKPRVDMNPVLLKPTGERGSQVVLLGRPHGNMEAAEYHAYKPRLREKVRASYRRLEEEFDAVVIEGAGSPAEINLRDNDIVNMGLARMLSAPVILVGDIDRGGVFASLYGTVKLLSEPEQRLIKGIVINKFRGDKSLLTPGIHELEGLVGTPVLGVLPYLDLALDDEDSLTERFQKSSRRSGLQIRIVLLPHISNFTDFNPLEMVEDVVVNYVREPGQIEGADMVVIPGSKNTLADRLYLKEQGWDPVLKRFAADGGLLVGICGGFQMLGEELFDPGEVESSLGRLPGLGLLPFTTTLAREKTTRQTEGRWEYSDRGYFAGMEGLQLKGYEIHMGESTVYDRTAVETSLVREDGSGEHTGLINERGNVFGTYWHGIFENREWTGRLLNNLRRARNLELRRMPEASYADFKDRQYDQLAATLRSELDMERFYSVLRSSDSASD